jgi:1,4-dihydroxy-6-naphthoate synthase
VTQSSQRATETTPIRLAFSPDSDDLFMFWPLLRGKIELHGLRFSAERADTETLNKRAELGDVDVIAVSIGHYAQICDQYMLLPHGASVGRGYGPVVVAKDERTLSSLKGARIAVPGPRTTAYAVLRMLLPEFEAVTVPISPYRATFDAVDAGTVEAALVIHEGRLTYETEGMKLVTDIGKAWAELTGFPLALGGNAIRRGLGEARIARISDLCRQSIAWSLAHRDEVMDGVLHEHERGSAKLDRATLDRYLSMYANEDTREMKQDVRDGITDLVTRMHAAGISRANPQVEFAP